MSDGVYKYQIKATSQFKKSAKLAGKRGKNVQKLKDVVELLASGSELPPIYKEGNWTLHRELHIENDWLLIYKIQKDVLILELIDTGTHSDLFRK